MPNYERRLPKVLSALLTVVESQLFLGTLIVLVWVKHNLVPPFPFFTYSVKIHLSTYILDTELVCSLALILHASKRSRLRARGRDFA